MKIRKFQNSAKIEKKRSRLIFMMWISESMIQLRYSIRINETMLNTLLAQNYFK